MPCSKYYRAPATFLDVCVWSSSSTFFRTLPLVATWQGLCCFSEVRCGVFELYRLQQLTTSTQEGKSYFELFDFLLWKEKLLAIGIYRTAWAPADSSGSPKILTILLHHEEQLFGMFPSVEFSQMLLFGSDIHMASFWTRPAWQLKQLVMAPGIIRKEEQTIFDRLRGFRSYSVRPLKSSWVCRLHRSCQQVEKTDDRGRSDDWRLRRKFRSLANFNLRDGPKVEKFFFFAKHVALRFACLFGRFLGWRDGKRTHPNANSAIAGDDDDEHGRGDALNALGRRMGDRWFRDSNIHRFQQTSLLGILQKEMWSSRTLERKICKIDKDRLGFLFTTILHLASLKVPFSRQMLQILKVAASRAWLLAGSPRSLRSFGWDLFGGLDHGSFFFFLQVSTTSV